jgi:hypothetical protein
MTIVSFGVDETGSVKRPSDARKQSKLSFSLLRLLRFSCEFDGSITGKQSSITPNAIAFASQIRDEFPKLNKPDFSISQSIGESTALVYSSLFMICRGNSIQQVSPLEWLGQILIHTRAETVFLILAHRIRRQSNDTRTTISPFFDNLASSL